MLILCLLAERRTTRPEHVNNEHIRQVPQATLDNHMPAINNNKLNTGKILGLMPIFKQKMRECVHENGRIEE
jgi:hypothetical protein